MAGHQQDRSKSERRRVERGGASQETSGSSSRFAQVLDVTDDDISVSELLRSSDAIPGQDAIPPVRSDLIPPVQGLENIAPGVRVANYQVLTKIGQGGMATIFLAQDVRKRRRVALKALLRKQAQGLGARRFKREFRALSRICHPNVVRVYEYGLFHEQPYFIMEYVPGKDLKASLPALREMPTAERYARIEALVVQVCRALEAIHSRGIIHRDLKPSNILLTADGQVKITDFGVAKPRDVSVQLTQENMLVGTLAYLAPEAFEKGELTYRVDLYALGVMLYGLLTGKLPFTGRTIAAMMKLHVGEEPIPPQEIEPTIPSHLEAITLRLMAKDPNARFQSAAEVIRELERTGSRPVRRQMTLEEGGSFLAGLESVWIPPVVGRHEALKSVYEAMGELDRGRGGVLILEGGLGVGKTRLAEVALAHAQELGIRVHRGACLPDGRGWCEGLKGLVASVAHEVEYSRDRKLVTLYSQAVESVGELDGLPPEANGAAPRASTRDDSTFEGMMRGASHQIPGPSTTMEALFRHLVRMAPRVLFVDDLEGADTGTLSALGTLIRNVSSRQPLLVLTAVRLNKGLPAPGVRALLTGERTGIPPKMVGLGPLGRTDTFGIVSDLVATSDAAQSLARRVHSEARGNPLHTVELMRLLVQKGYISKDSADLSGHRRLTLDAAQIRSDKLQIPRSLLAVIGERLSPHPAATRTLLKLVAAWERDVSLELLLKVTAAKEELLISHVDKLLAEGVMVERWVGGRERYDFAHPMYRRAVLATIPETELKELRAAIATRLDDG